MSQTVFEKLQIREERNILIQGLPSSIEKQFLKITYSKSVTPLLKSRTIDFALIFAVNQQQLANIIGEVIPSLHKKSKFWVAYPKPTSKIVLPFVLMPSNKFKYNDAEFIKMLFSSSSFDAGE
jgi:hypothetical protein